MSTTNIIVDRRGAVGILTLDRPEALNSLNMDMLRTMRDALRVWHADSSIQAIVLKGNGRAFCAGGDVKAVVSQREDPQFLDEIYRVEYEVDQLLHYFGRPVIAMIHGATMGGGCGISLHASHPVGADDLVLAMPEVAIGFFPDIAGTLFLSRCPDNVGLYLALTGARIGANDAILCGLIKAVVPRHHQESLIEAIGEGVGVDEAIARLATAPAPHSVLKNREQLASAFAGSSVAEIIDKLRSDGSEWAHETLLTLSQQCPFSLEVTKRVYDRAIGKTLVDALASDFRVAQRMTMRNDYVEGVRARLVVRDQRPVWQPSKLELVNSEEVERCFNALEIEL
jgi:enoyl-CoA hydratase/carnithine racemase